MIQIADIVGAAGVSFVVAMVNGLLADLVLFIRCPSGAGRSAENRGICPLYSARRPSGKIVFAGVCRDGPRRRRGTVLYGQWRLRQTGQYVSEGPLVASLQSNVPTPSSGASPSSVHDLRRADGKSKAAAAAGAELIVWPETMVQGLLDPSLWPYLDGDLDEDKAFHQALCEHAKDKAYVLVGAHGRRDPARPRAANRTWASYNSAYLLPAGRDPGPAALRQDPSRPLRRVHPVQADGSPGFSSNSRCSCPKGWNPDYSLEHGTRYTIFEMAAAEATVQV